MLAVLFETPVSTHHSFAMYDQTKVVTLTGVMKQFVPQANHAELHFILLAPDHKALAKGDGRQVRRVGRRDGGHRRSSRSRGSPATTFGAGTVFSVKLNPLRDGSNFGARVGAIARCPMDRGHQEAEAPRGRQALRFGDGPHADRRHDVLTAADVKQFALWLSTTSPERLHPGAQRLDHPGDPVDSHRRDRPGDGIRADDRSADPRMGVD